MTDLEMLDRVRLRWRDHHVRLGLPGDDPGQEGAVEPAGLGRRVADLSTRIVILPADPTARLLEFDDELWRWWGEDRPAPFGASPIQWAEGIPTVDAAVRVRPGRDTWETFLALHRHGGVELGTADTYDVREQRYFRLIRTVGLLWLALDVQALVLRHVEVAGPWEVTLALHGTRDAHLGNVGKGWREPGDFSWDAPPCHEPNVVIREELSQWPEEPDHLREVAYRLGGRIEDAWGMRQRRFLDRQGEHEGEFDPRYWRL